MRVETQFKLPVEHEICLDPLKTLFSSNGQLCVFYWVKSVDVTFLKENHFPKNVPYYFTIYGMIFRYQTRRFLLSYCCKGIVTSNWRFLAQTTLIRSLISPTESEYWITVAGGIEGSSNGHHYHWVGFWKIWEDPCIYSPLFSNFREKGEKSH